MLAREMSWPPLGVLLDRYSGAEPPRDLPLALRAGGHALVEARLRIDAAGHVLEVAPDMVERWEMATPRDYGPGADGRQKLAGAHLYVAFHFKPGVTPTWS